MFIKVAPLPALKGFCIGLAVLVIRSRLKTSPHLVKEKFMNISSRDIDKNIPAILVTDIWRQRFPEKK